MQSYADLPMHGKQVTIVIQRRRWRCKECGRVSLDPLPDMDDKRSATIRLVEYVRREAMKRTFTSLSTELGILTTTARDIFLDYAAYLDASVTFVTPRVLGIDEIHLTGQPRCVLTNVEEKTLYDLLPTRTKDALYRRMVEMPDRRNVQVVTIDMHRPYKDAAEAAFPGVVVIVDKWHVLRLANQCLETVRKSVRDSLTPTQRRTLMHDRFVLLKRFNKLSAEDTLKLEAWTGFFPLLRQAYDLKESFYMIYDIYDLWDTVGAKRAIVAWSDSVPAELATHFAPLITALKNWTAEITAYFDHGRYTNAYTEAFNSLIRVSARMGRGYSFEVIRAKMLYSKATGMHHHPKSGVLYERGHGSHSGSVGAIDLGFLDRLMDGPNGSFGADISTLVTLLESEADAAETTR